MTDPTDDRFPLLSEASVAFLLEHRAYPGCTMASLTIRERLEVIERQAAPLDKDDLDSIALALQAFPTWFDETAEKVAALRRALAEPVSREPREPR